MQINVLLQKHTLFYSHNLLRHACNAVKTSQGNTACLLNTEYISLCIEEIIACMHVCAVN